MRASGLLNEGKDITEGVRHLEGLVAAACILRRVSAHQAAHLVGAQVDAHPKPDDLSVVRIRKYSSHSLFMVARPVGLEEVPLLGRGTDEVFELVGQGLGDGGGVALERERRADDGVVARALEVHGRG